MTLFFPSCLQVSLPASITKPRKINMALRTQRANIKQHSHVQRTRTPPRRRQLPPRWVHTSVLCPTRCYCIKWWSYVPNNPKFR